MKKKIVKKNKIKPDKNESAIKKIIYILISFAIALFLGLSTFDKCGAVGRFIKICVLSVFGTMGYFFPIVFVCMALLVLFSEQKVSKLKKYSLILAYIMLLSIMHLNLNERQFDSKSFLDIFLQYVDSKQIIFSFEYGVFSGGALGAIFAEGFSMYIGEAGAMILLSSLFLIFLLLFTGIKFYSNFFGLLLDIIMFIPKCIIKLFDRNYDDEMLDESEDIFNETKKLNKNEKTININYDYNNNVDTLKENRRNNRETINVLESLQEDNKIYKEFDFDKEARQINLSGIQKNLFYLDDENNNTNSNKSEELKNKMKKESLNEIFYNDKNLTENDFFNNTRIDDENYNDKYNASMADYMRRKEEKNDITFNANENESYNENIEIVNNNNLYNNDVLNREPIKEKRIIRKSEPVKVRPIVPQDDDSYKKIVPIKKIGYRFPPNDFLNRNVERTFFDKDYTKGVSEKLTETLAQFGVGVVVTDVSVGPTITRYELQPNLGVKVSKVLSLQDDIKLALAASDIRIEAPIPGKSAIGIEVPNRKKIPVLLGDLVCVKEFKEQKSALSVCVGKDIAGKNIYCDLEKMPHLLVAGATGSGKSVCINTMIMSLIYKSSPDDVKLLLIDPKMVELQIYNNIPHLASPVVTDPKKASNVLNWAVEEMTKRYQMFAEKQVRDLKGYNQLIEMQNKNAIYEDSKEKKMARIVIIIDELSDLMMTCGKNVESSIVRLAQLSRACGIHLVIATQKPVVSVVTGLIKSNVPSRIAFSVSSGVDSRTILDMNGAEDLIGNGDMLYFPTGSPKPTRVQGCYVSDDEIKKVVDYIKIDDIQYDEEIVKAASHSTSNSIDIGDEKDELFYEAGQLCIESEQPSIGLLQRKFRVGFNRAARIIDQLEAEGILSPQDGKKARVPLVTKEEFEEKYGGK